MNLMEVSRMPHHTWCGLTLALLLALASPALAGSVRCTTSEVKSLGRLQTLCADGTRATHTYNKTLGRWESTVTPPPGQTCTGRLHPAPASGRDAAGK
jgi:hypothetical protein